MSSGGKQGGSRGQASGGQSSAPGSGSAPGSAKTETEGFGQGIGKLVDTQNATDPGATGAGGVAANNSGSAVADVSAQEEIAMRMAALEAAELELAERRRELDEREQQLKNDLESRGRAVRDEAAAFCGPEGGYNFEVGAVNQQMYPTLKPIVIRAVDESEAKRFFCATHHDPTKPGKQVDPVKIDIAVRCVDPRRQEAINRTLQIAAIRRKRDQGNPLNEQEEATLSLHERAIL